MRNSFKELLWYSSSQTLIVGESSERLIKTQIAGPHSQGFCPKQYREPENLHFSQVPGDADAASLGTTLLWWIIFCKSNNLFEQWITTSEFMFVIYRIYQSTVDCTGWMCVNVICVRAVQSWEFRETVGMLIPCTSLSAAPFQLFNHPFVYLSPCAKSCARI